MTTRCLVCGGIDGTHHPGCPQNRIPELRPTLRDQFAMAALPETFRFARDCILSAAKGDKRFANPTKYAADCAYELADAMMEARKTPGPSTAPETPK